MNACYKDRGEDFRANVSVTEKGLKCQHWNATKPHHHILSPTEYPELAGGHNFCRNPGGKKEKPWCFTTDVDFKFDYCDIPSCGKLVFFFFLFLNLEWMLNNPYLPRSDC